MLVAAAFALALHGVGVALPPGPSRTIGPPLMRGIHGRQSVERRQQIANHMKELDTLRTVPPCDACELAKAKLREMEEDGFVPNSHAITIAIGLCSADLPAAEAFFKQLHEGTRSEGSYALLLRAQLAHGELDRALSTWRAMVAHGIRPRVRTTSPLLIALCGSERHEEAMALYSELRQHGMDLTQQDYSAMLLLHGRGNEARQAMSVLAHLAEDFPRPDDETIAAIVELFKRLDLATAQMPISNPNLGFEAHDKADVHHEFHNYVDDGAHDQTFDHAEASSIGHSKASHACAPGAERVVIGPDGKCPCCGAQLQLLTLSNSERDEVRKVLLARAAERQGESGSDQLRTFSKWLEKQPPFDYVIDGPNVGYANQNFEGGRFEFTQVAAVLQLLQRKGKRVLLILPRKYAKDVIPNHTSSTERDTRISKVDRDILEEWKRQNIVYLCHSGLYDDWFWMLATVSGASPPRAVTNDAMRDHLNELLPQRAFQRWRHSQIVSFSIGYLTPETPIPQSKPPRSQPIIATVESPPVFSRQAQRLNGRWHIPMMTNQEEESHQWLCCTADAPMASESLEFSSSI